MFAAALAGPGKFKVFRWVVNAALPQAMQLFSQALDEKSTVAEGSSFIRVLKMVVAEAQKYSGAVDWKEVAKAILKTQPSRPGDVLDLCEYVKVWGGLPSGSLVEDMVKHT